MREERPEIETNLFSSMESELLPPSNSNKRRIMIITADESIIEQIQNSDHSALFKSIIIEPKDLNSELSSLSNESHTVNSKKLKNNSLTCVVCGSPALGYNFDAITCESCKAFFRRNAMKDPSSLHCRRKGGCEITVETRRRCPACRLTKCFDNGMKRERLQTAEEKAVKRRKIQENRTFTMQSCSTANEEDPNLLTPALSDHLSTFDEANPFPVVDFTDLLTPQSSEPPKALLSSEDLQRMETVRISYQQRIELAAREGLPWNPSVYGTTFLQHINFRSVAAVRLLTFFKQIPEFDQLMVDDKVILIKYNLMPLVMLNHTLSYRSESDQVIESESDFPWHPRVFKEYHGNDLYVRIKKVFDSFVRIAQDDQRIVQLTLITLILSKGFSTDPGAMEPILSDGMAVYRAQSYYVELLWKYMETVHGPVKSTRIFNDLFSHFMSWQTLGSELLLSVRSMLSPLDTKELLPIMRSLLQIS